MTEPLRVLIADDELMARQRLTRLLGAIDGVTIAGEAKDGDEVLTAARAGGCDVVLLDVHMPKLSGTDALALWPKDGPWVIFCTAHAEHAVKAFDGGALDYVLKPVEPDRLAKALARARARLSMSMSMATLPPPATQARIDRIPVQTRQGVVLVPPDEVTHATLEGELVTLHTTAAHYLTDATLQELHERLGDRVERVHRRALLNVNAVARLEPLETGGYLARLPAGGSVEVSRQAARELRRRLGLRKGPGDDD